MCDLLRPGADPKMTRGPAKLVFKRIPDMSEKRKERKKLFTGSFSRSFSIHTKKKSKQRDLTSVSDLYSLNTAPVFFWPAPAPALVKNRRKSMLQKN